MKIWTDGSCLDNPGPGGWAFLTDRGIRVTGAWYPITTNNKMELKAVGKALSYVLRQEGLESVEILTDSEYVKNGITKWINGWKAHDWHKADGKPVENPDWWKWLDQLVQQVQEKGVEVKWTWVRGHSKKSDPDYSKENALVDQMARKAVDSVKYNQKGMSSSSRS